MQSISGRCSTFLLVSGAILGSRHLDASAASLGELQLQVFNRWSLSGGNVKSYAIIVGNKKMAYLSIPILIHLLLKSQCKVVGNNPILMNR